MTYNGTTWSSPVDIDGSVDLTAVSCVTSSFCIAIDAAGNYLTYNGTSWTNYGNVDSNYPATFNLLSCVSTTFCMAGDEHGYVYTFISGSWSPYTYLSTYGDFGLSCASTSFCMLVGSSGAFTWNGSSWSSPVGMDGATGPDSISCPSTTYCVSVDNLGYYSVYSGTAWTDPVGSNDGAVYVTGASGFYSVSCTSTSFCMAVDSAGNAFVFNGTTWSAADNIDGTIHLYSVSCVEAGSGTVFCVTVDSAQNAFEYLGAAQAVPTDETQLLAEMREGYCGVSSPTCCPCQVKGPINMESGNLYEQVTDINIPGRGYNLNLSRSYNSLSAATNGPFGYGWTSNIGASLVESGGDTVATITDESGSPVTFTLSGSTWSAPEFNASTLTYNSGVWTYSRWDGKTMNFNSSGQLTSETDRNGNTTAFTYSSGKLATMTDASGRTLAFTWTGSNITQVEDPDSQTVTYTYDGSGNLHEVTNQAGGHMYYTYDGSHNLLTVEDPNTNMAETNTFNGSNQVLTQTDAMSRETTFSYNSPDPNVTTTLETDANGDETLYTCEYGLLIEKITGYGTSIEPTTTYQYDPNSLGITSETDPNGNVTTNTYDSNGNLLTTTDPLGRETVYTYNDLNEVLTKTDPLGVTTTNTYDADGNLLTTSTPLKNSLGVTIATRETQQGYGDPNSAISSNGTDGLAVANASTLPTGSAARTVSLWFKTSNMANQMLYSYGTQTTDEWFAVKLQDSGLQIAFSGSTDDHTYTLSSNVANGAWHHILLDYDGGTSLSLYMDGTLVATATLTAALSTVNTDLYVGQNTWAGSDNWDGAMEDFAVYPGSYTSIPSGVQPSMYYQFGEMAGTTVYDVSGNGDNAVYAPSGLTYQVTGASMGYDYNPSLPTTEIDPNGNVSESIYDWYGNLVASSDALGDTTSYSYDILGRKLTSVSPDGDVQGNLPSVFTTTYTYNALNEVLTTAQPLKPKAWYRFGEQSGPIMYDSSGNGVDGTYTASGITYGVSGALPKDPTTAVSTSNPLHDIGSAPSTNLPSGATARTISVYYKTTSSANQMLYSYGTQTTDEWFGVELTNSAEKLDFSGSSDPATFTLPYATDDGNWHQLVLVYNGSEGLSLYLDGLLVQTATLGTVLDTTGSTLYIGLNTWPGSDKWFGAMNELEFFSGTPLTTINTYDGDGNLLTTTDPMGNVTVNTYDADNELTEVQSENPSLTVVKTTHTGYDSDGNVTSQTDGNGNVTHYYYNDLNEQTSSETALSQTTTYTYDLDGNLQTLADPNGHTATYTYNADSELTGISYSDGVTHAVTYSYDADGHKTGMIDGTGTSAWTYDTLGRLTSYTNGNGNEVQYGYDIAGNETSIEYPGGDTVTQAFNAVDEMSSLTDWNSKETTFSYDANGSLTGESLPNGVTDTNTYDPANNLTSISDVNGSTTIFASDYTHNSDNLITTDSSQPSSTQNYQYTALNQVCYAGSSNSSACTSPPTGAIPYAYDSAGNLTTNNGSTQTFNAGDELCWSVSGSSSNGCGAAPTGATTYSYDSNGNRTAATPSSGSASSYTYNGVNELTQYQLGSGTATTYAYDGNGLRQSKTTGSTTTNFLWDESTSLPLLLQETTGSSTTNYVYGPTGLPLEEVLPSGTTYYYASDSLGSTRALTDASGAVANTDTYDPYGNITASTGSTANPLLYAGQYLDSESGLYYMRARYYDPTTAQFLTVDPMVESTQSPYAYTAGDPINTSDHSGECISIGCWFAQEAESHGLVINQPCWRLGGGNWTSNDTNGCESTLSSGAGVVLVTTAIPAALGITATAVGAVAVGTAVTGGVIIQSTVLGLVGGVSDQEHLPQESPAVLPPIWRPGEEEPPGGEITTGELGFVCPYSSVDYGHYL